MEHVEDLQRYKALWEDLKESLPREQTKLAQKAIELPPGAARDEQIAIAKSYSTFLRLMNAKEHEAHATTRRQRQASREQVRLTLHGFAR